MEKLIKYLLKVGIEPANRMREQNIYFFEQTCGHKDYFMEAPNYTCKRIGISFDYNVAADKEYFMRINQLEKMLQTYCKRFGYSIESHSTSYGVRFLYIMKQSEKKDLEAYFDFTDKCVKDWEIMQHHFYNINRPELSEQAAIILNKIYSLRYRQYLKAVKAN